MVAIVAGTIQLAIRISSVLSMFAKLPIVHKMKSCTSFGFEKYCNTFTIAAVMLPNIIPMISNEAVSLTFGAIAKINKITIVEPIKAKIAVPIVPLHADKKPTVVPPASVNNATPRLAPVLTPSTYGSASGFLNNVCINKPEIGKAIPTNNAVQARGRRRFTMMLYHNESAFPFNTSQKPSNGIFTLPNKMSATKQIGIKISNMKEKSLFTYFF